MAEETAAAAMAATEVGFDEGMCWLPSHVIDEALIAENRNRRCTPLRNRDAKIDIDSPTYSIKHYSRGRFNNNNSRVHASGGPGMQAIFLDSGQRTCGTGVFIPSTKPASSPVLLPYRVVQALNLNMKALGSMIVSRGEIKPMNFEYKKLKNDDMLKEKMNSSDVFLPKEWTY